MQEWTYSGVTAKEQRTYYGGAILVEIGKIEHSEDVEQEEAKIALNIN